MQTTNKTLVTKLMRIILGDALPGMPLKEMMWLIWVAQGVSVISYRAFFAPMRQRCNSSKGKRDMPPMTAGIVVCQRFAVVTSGLMCLILLGTHAALSDGPLLFESCGLVWVWPAG